MIVLIDGSFCAGKTEEIYVKEDYRKQGVAEI
jgi:hypothetical protein